MTDRDRTKNIVMIGLNEHNRKALQAIYKPKESQFNSLMNQEDEDGAESRSAFNIAKMLADFELRLDSINGSIDAITTYLDTPYVMLAPILCEKYNLPSATLNSVLKCHHKYWGRKLHQEIVPEVTPDYCLLDPFEDDPFSKINIAFPFWLKPITSEGSFLGFRINNAEDFHQAIASIREKIDWLASPFNDILKLADIPDDIKQVQGHYCLAEQWVDGHKCTIEGYVQDGQVSFIGIVDTIHQPNSHAAHSYRYPSQLPEEVQTRIRKVSTSLLHYIQYDNQAFNIDFFWDEAQDKLWLLEINARISYMYSDNFRLVDGASNHQIAVNVALGQAPKFPSRQGKYTHSAIFFFRIWNDGVVSRVPTDSELESIQDEIEDTFIDMWVKKGERLSDAPLRDTYAGYSVAHIVIGGQTEAQIKEKYQACETWLSAHFELQPE